MITIEIDYISEDAMRGELPRQRPNVQNTYCEIMQIGACKLDTSGKELGHMNICVHPFRFKRMPPWLSDITGMTDEKRRDGMAFPKALAALREFAGNDKDIWTFSGDWWVIGGNTMAHRIAMPFPRQFRRLKPLLPRYDIRIDRFRDAGYTEICCRGLRKVLGIELPRVKGIKSHDAVHDARILAYALWHLKPE